MCIRDSFFSISIKARYTIFFTASSDGNEQMCIRDRHNSCCVTPSFSHTKMRTVHCSGVISKPIWRKLRDSFRLMAADTLPFSMAKIRETVRILIDGGDIGVAGIHCGIERKRAKVFDDGAVHGVKNPIVRCV